MGERWIWDKLLKKSAQIWREKGGNYKYTIYTNSLNMPTIYNNIIVIYNLDKKS
jgi:hypothetical protein